MFYLFARWIHPGLHNACITAHEAFAPDSGQQPRRNWTGIDAGTGLHRGADVGIGLPREAELELLHQGRRRARLALPREA